MTRLPLAVAACALSLAGRAGDPLAPGRVAVGSNYWASHAGVRM